MSHQLTVVLRHENLLSAQVINTEFSRLGLPCQIALDASLEQERGSFPATITTTNPRSNSRIAAGFRNFQIFVNMLEIVIDALTFYLDQTWMSAFWSMQLVPLYHRSAQQWFITSLTTYITQLNRVWQRFILHSKIGNYINICF
jgi:hypothetical protein